MPAIIDPFHASDTQHPFKELERDPARLRATMARFERILEASFAFDAQRDGTDFAARINTAAERRRRAAILAKWFRALRGLGHSVERSIDDLSRALRCELDGDAYQPPPKNRVWLPGGEA
jgi:hypothetical protein